MDELNENGAIKHLFGRCCIGIALYPELTDGVQDAQEARRRVVVNFAQGM